MPRGQEGPEGVQPCLGPDERSEPGDFHVHTQHRPRFRGRIAQGGTTGRPGMSLDIIAAPCGTPVGVALAVALPCRTGQTRYRAGASPAPTGRSVCHSTPAGPGGVRVSNLSEGSLRSPPAKHGSTPYGAACPAGTRVSSRVVGRKGVTEGRVASSSTTLPLLPRWRTFAPREAHLHQHGGTGVPRTCRTKATPWLGRDKREKKSGTPLLRRCAPGGCHQPPQGRTAGLCRTKSITCLLARSMRSYWKGFR